MSETPSTPETLPEIIFEVNPSESVPVPVDDTLSVEGEAADAAAVGAALASAAETTAENLASAVSTLNAAIAALFPVGAIYATTSSSAPAFYGTWVEVMIPTTWGDLNTGARNYSNVGTGDTPGTIHFWRRTA